MGETPKDGQAKTRKPPEQIRAERIEAVKDPRVRQELDELVKARDAKLAEIIERQKETYAERVQTLRNKKIRNLNGPHLTPPGLQPRPYLGTGGHARAETDAKAQIQTQDHKYRERVARPYNEQIDRKLDAYERARADSSRGNPPSVEITPRRLVKFEDRFPEAVKREITR